MKELKLKAENALKRSRCYYLMMTPGAVWHEIHGGGEELDFPMARRHARTRTFPESDFSSVPSRSPACIGYTINDWWNRFHGKNIYSFSIFWFSLFNLPMYQFDEMELLTFMECFKNTSEVLKIDRLFSLIQHCKEIGRYLLLNVNYVFMMIFIWWSFLYWVYVLSVLQRPYPSTINNIHFSAPPPESKALGKIAALFKKPFLKKLGTSLGYLDNLSLSISTESIFRETCLLSVSLVA